MKFLFSTEIKVSVEVAAAVTKGGLKRPWLLRAGRAFVWKEEEEGKGELWPSLLKRLHCTVYHTQKNQVFFLSFFLLVRLLFALTLTFSIERNREEEPFPDKKPSRRGPHSADIYEYSVLFSGSHFHHAGLQPWSVSSLALQKEEKRRGGRRQKDCGFVDARRSEGSLVTRCFLFSFVNFSLGPRLSRRKSTIRIMTYFFCVFKVKILLKREADKGRETTTRNSPDDVPEMNGRSCGAHLHWKALNLARCSRHKIWEKILAPPEGETRRH